MNKKILLFTLLFILACCFNSAKAQFTEQYAGSLIPMSGGSVAWGDYDNDGDLDIGMSGTSNSGYISKIYQNTGTGFTEVYAGSVIGGIYSTIDWGDYDNDGDLDILFSGYSNSGMISKIYRNTGTGFSEVYAGSITGVYIGSSAWGDYDNDGDLDILLTGNYNGSYSGGLAKIYQNTGSGFTEVYPGSLQKSFWGSAEWGDYDNDGDLDILLTGHNGTTGFSKLYRNTGTGFTEVYAGSLLGVYFSSALWGDYDNDGDLDILLTGTTNGSDYNSKIYQNTGTGFTEVYAGSMMGVNSHECDNKSAWGDYDNDGDLDILITGSSSGGLVSKIYQNTGSGFAEVYAGSLTGVRFGSVAWGDYDNDNDLDILLTGTSNSAIISKIYSNDGVTSNSMPSSPANLSQIINGSDVTFSWDVATDLNQTNGLSYNLYVYDVTDAVFKTGIEAFRQTSPDNGKRLVAKTGSIQGVISGNTVSYTLKGILQPCKNYEWSVQSVDAGLAGSPFATEKSFSSDITAPVPNAATLANITAECSVSSLEAPTATDNCAGTVIGTHNVTLPITAQGTTVVTWTYNDGNGNSTTQIQNVIIDDVTTPLAPTLATLTGECSVTATAPTTTDACAGSITGTTTDPLEYNSQGTFVIEWTFDDGHGNNVNVDQTVIIDDVTPPVAPTLPVLSADCSLTVTAPTTTDVCAGTITGTTTDPLEYNSQGTFVIEWTFDDGHGNNVNVDQTIIIDDVTNPVAPTLPVLSADCSLTVTAPTTTDVCAGTITGTTTDPLEYNSQGTFVIEWTFDDGHGNNVNVDQTIIIDDVTNPVAPTLPVLTAECSLTVTAPTTTDVCAGTITGTTTDPLEYNSQGTFVIEWTFDDGHGNNVNVDQTVIIDDVTPPIAPTLPVLTAECSLTVTAPTTTDACAGTITGTTTDPLEYNSQGTFVIEWTFDDGHGNNVNVDQTVIIDDVTPPIAPTLPVLTAECSLTVTAPTTTDACAGTITGTTTDPLEYNSQGTFVIEWTFDDGNGNNVNVDQTVIIDDVTPPIAPTLPVLTAECSLTVTAPTTTDACAGTITGTTTDPLEYNSQGTFVIEWTFDDGNGNNVNVDQTIIIDDVTNPVTPTLPVLTAECSLTVTAPTTTDVCAGTITGTTTDPLEYNSQGTFVIEWTFDDGHGNNVNVDQTVIIDDVTPPIAPTLPVLTAECSLTVTAPTTTDVCAGTITGTTTDPLEYNTQGTFVIEWTFDDGNGNNVNVDQTVIIDDVTPPITPTLPVLTAECSLTVTAPTTTDVCAGTITGTTTDPLEYNTQGTFVIEWTFDDGNGNNVNVDQTVIIDDVTPPITPTLPVLTAECSLTVTAPTTTDVCAGTITGTTTDPLEYNSQGTFVIEWTFDDGHGNNVNVDQTVIIDDVTPPVAPTLPVLTAECSLTVTAPTTTDVCAGTITGTTSDPLEYNSQGTFVIEWTFDDGNGNNVNVDQTVIIDDVTPSVAPTLPVLTAECSLTVTAPTTTDVCAGTITGTTSDPLEYNSQGTFVIEWTFDDGNGNNVNVDQTVIIDDVTPSVAPTLPVLTAECSLTVTAPTTTDVCAGTIIGTTSDPLEYNTQGTFVIEWTFDDGNGNNVNVDQTVIIDDVTPPIAPTLPVLTAECSLTVTAPTTTDVCAGTITGTTSDPLEYNTQGTFVIEWTFDDGNGNNVNVDQTVIIDDVTNPTIICIENQVINLNEGETFYTIQGTEFDPLEAADNCNVQSIENDLNNLTTIENVELPIGITTIVWTVTDIAGNTETCSFEITVNAYISVSSIELVQVSVYPNPTNGILNIEFSDFIVQNITIVDITGKVIIEKAVTAQTENIDLSTFANGVYLIRLQTDKEIFTTKIVKE